MPQKRYFNLFTNVCCIIRNRIWEIFEGGIYLKKDNSKTPYDSYLESFERIRKSLMPLNKTLSKRIFDTSSLTGSIENLNNRIAEMWKDYQNVDISKSMLATLKATCIPLDISETYKQSMESFIEIGRQFSAVNIAEEYAKSLDSFQNISKSLMSVSTIDTARSFQTIQEAMKYFTDNLMSEQISHLRSIDYGKIFSETLESNGTFKDAVDAAYESLQEEENDAEEVGLETDFANEQEIQDTINDQINNPIGFQERVKNWAEEKQKKYFIVIFFIRLFLSIFVVPCLQNWGLTVATKCICNVKTLPQKEAEVMYQLKENTEATIVENTNYYYKVTFIDENGAQREGYVAKRNLEIVEESDTKNETEEEESTEE